MGGAATQSTSVRIPPPGAAHARGAPSAEEAAPCISRLRPPLPATTLPAQAGPRCLPGRGLSCRHTRTVPPGATPGPRPTPHAPLHRAARAGTCLGRRNDPGPQPGRPIRTASLASRPFRASPSSARPTRGPVHPSRASRAAPRPCRRARTISQPGRPTGADPPTHSQADNAHRRHPQARPGFRPHHQAGRPARSPSRPQEQLRRPELQRCRHPAGPWNCRPRIPP